MIDARREGDTLRSSYSSAALFVGLVVVAALLVRTTRLDESLWFDELWSTRLKLGSLWLLLMTMGSDHHPPGYTLLMYGWTRVAGDGEFAIRLVPLVAGVATVPLVYQLGRRAFDETTGRIAALLLALSSVHAWYSQEARAYALNVSLCVLATLAAAEVIRRPDRRGWRLLCGATLLALPLIHYYNVVAVFVLAVSLLRLPRASRGYLVWVGAMGIGLGICFAGAKQLLGLFPPAPYLGSFSPAASWRLLFSWFLSGDGFSWLLEPPVLGPIRWTLQVLAAAVLTAGLRRSVAIGLRQPGAVIVTAMFLAPLSMLLGLWLVGAGGTYLPRSALTALPFFLLLLAAGVSRAVKPVRLTVAGILIALQAVGLWSVWQHPDAWTINRPREDWRSLAVWLRQHLPDSGEQTMLLATDPAISLSYYDDSFAERIDFATKLKDRSGPIAERLGAIGVNASPLLKWVARGADEAEERSRRARVLIVDAPLVAGVAADLLDGRLAAPVIAVQVGGGEPGRVMTALGESPNFERRGHARFRGLEAAIFEPRATPGRGETAASVR